MFEGTGGWYLRARGRVLGPFNWAQLASLRDRGQLLQADELSQDRRSWVKAADVAGLFSPAETTARPAAATSVEWASRPAGEPQAAPASQSAPCWFIARGETHHGPLHLEDVQRMIDVGELGPSSLVWRHGMADWTPASQVTGLWFATHAGASASGPGGAHSPQPIQAMPAASDTQGPSHVSALAVASLVLGVLWLCGIGSLLATIFGAVASSQISRSEGAATGRGMAVAGLILGILGLCLAIIVVSLGSFGLLEAIRNRAWGTR